MSEYSQGLTRTQDVEWGFLLSATLPTSGVATQSHYICLLRVLRPIGKPVNTMDFILLKESNRAFVAWLGVEIDVRPSLFDNTCHHIMISYTVINPG
jgi:hypothetical protein